MKYGMNEPIESEITVVVGRRNNLVIYYKSQDARQFALHCMEKFGMNAIETEHFTMTPHNADEPQNERVVFIVKPTLPFDEVVEYCEKAYFENQPPNTGNG